MDTKQTAEEKAEIDAFYQNPTLEGLDRARDDASFIMRLGAKRAFDWEEKRTGVSRE